MTIDERARAALLDKRKSLLIRYRDELDDVDALVGVREPDWEDLAAEQRDAAVLDRLSDGDADDLRAIVEALRRLEAGTYGRCEHCAQPIDPARLTVLPEATLCAECATEAEAPPPEPPETASSPPAVHRLRARVVRPLPGLRFHLETDTGRELTAYHPRGVRYKRVKLAPGDTVVVEASEEDPHHLRIVPEHTAETG